MITVYVLAHAAALSFLEVKEEISYRDLFEKHQKDMLIEVGKDRDGGIDLIRIYSIDRYRKDFREPWTEENTAYRHGEKVEVHRYNHAGEWKESHGGTSRNREDSLALSFMIDMAWRLADRVERSLAIGDVIGELKGEPE